MTPSHFRLPLHVVACLMLAWVVLVFLDLPAAGGPPASGKGVQPRVDRYGDVLPPGAVARLGTIRFRQAGRVAHLACSPDGKWVATVNGKVVRLWDMATGKEVRQYRGHADWIRCLAYSPNGKVIAAGAADESILVWDAATGKKVQRLTGQKEKESAGFGRRMLVTFSPDGKALATRGGDETIRLWDVATGKEVWRFEGHPEHVWSIAFSADGRNLAAFASTPYGTEEMKPGWIWVWDVATGKDVRRWRLPDSDVCLVALSPDLKTLVTCLRFGGPRELKLWDVATGKHVRSLSEYPRALTFSADGKALVSARDDRFRVWEVATGKVMRTVKNPFPQGFEHFAFCPDGKTFVCWGYRNAPLFCDATTGEQVRRFGGHSHTVSAVAFSRDGKLLATGGGQDVRLWEVAAWRQVRKFDGGRGSFVALLAFSHDDKTLLAELVNHKVCAWEVAGGGEVPGVPGRSQVRHLTISPDGKRMAAAGELINEKQSIALWDLPSWKRLNVWQPNQEWVSARGFSPDGKLLALSGGAKSILLYDVTRGRELSPVGKHARWVTGVNFSPDGRLLVGVEWHEKIHLYETATGLPRAVLDTGGNVSSVAFSPDGRHLAAVNDGTFRRASPDGKTDGNEGADKVCLLDVATGKVVHCVGSHPGGVASVAFSPDGKLLAVGSWDTTTIVWDVGGVLRGAASPPVRLDGRLLQTLWGDLAGADGAKAHGAVWALAAVPAQSLPFLKERVRPFPVPEPRRLAQLLADLDSGRFAVREKAGRELEGLTGLAGKVLRAALASPRSIEFRRRVELLLARLDGPVQYPEVRRALRVVEVLEHVGTAEARAFLAELSRGAPGARLTREALVALRRLVAGRGVDTKPAP